MSDQLHYRSFHQDLEVRASTKGRVVRGIAVPWNVEALIGDGVVDVEGFRPGAFDHQLAAFNRVKFAREHIIRGGRLIGRGLMARNDGAGLYVELLAARTLLGDETVALLEDEALTNLSVCFKERQTTKARSRSYPGRMCEWRQTGDLFEVAVVLEGAYGDLALATGVRASAEPRPGIMEARRLLESLPPLPPVA